MLGNPIGLIHTMGDGVAGFVRGVGRGLATGDGDEILRGSQKLMGGVVGGVSGAGARLTHSLHSVLSLLSAGGGGDGDSDDESGARSREYAPRQGHDLGEGVLVGGRGALHTLGRGITGLLQRPMQGAMQRTKPQPNPDLSPLLTPPIPDPQPPIPTPRTHPCARRSTARRARARAGHG